MNEEDWQAFIQMVESLLVLLLVSTVWLVGSIVLIVWLITLFLGPV